MTARYVVAKTVPIPSTPMESEYPFNEMEVGDSFPVPPEEHFKAYKAAMNQNARTRPRKHFIIRKTKIEIRIWRTK
jgi:hypothetical protein